MAIPVVTADHSEMWVGERMAKIAEADLVGALDVLHMASAGDLGPMGIHSWGAPAETILTRSIAAGGALREQAIAAINNFTERGYSQFERLLPE
jgi:hypothetical protein